MKTISSPYIDRLPPAPPADAPVVVTIGLTVVACNPSRGRSGSFYEPPECEVLGNLYLLLRSKQKWVPLDLDNAPHLIDQIWEELDRVREQHHGDFGAWGLED